MKKLFFCTAALLPLVLFSGCEDDFPEDIAAEEVIQADTEDPAATRSDYTTTLFEYTCDENEQYELITLPNGIQVEYYDGDYYFQGDILIEEDEIEEFGQISSRSVYNFFAEKWNNKTVPYSIDDGIPDCTAILKAMEMWTEACGIQFVPVRQGGFSNRIVFKKNKKRNSSRVGRKKAAVRQSIQLKNWDNPGVVAHEIGHALGLEHEHTHPRRGDFITIHWDNIRLKNEHNFTISTGSISTDMRSMDYSSIMMYDPYSFARNSNRPTISRKDGQSYSAQREFLSLSDIQAIRSRYNEDKEFIKGPDEYYSYMPAKFQFNVGSMNAQNIRWVLSDNTIPRSISRDGLELTINPIDSRDITIAVEFTLPGSSRTITYTAEKNIRGNRSPFRLNFSRLMHLKRNQSFTFVIERIDHPAFNPYSGVWGADWFCDQSGYVIESREKDRARIKFERPGTYNFTLSVDNNVVAPGPITTITMDFVVEVSEELYPEVPYFNRPNEIEYVQTEKTYYYSCLYDYYKYEMDPHFDVKLNFMNYTLTWDGGWDFSMIYHEPGDYTFDVDLIGYNKQVVDNFVHRVEAYTQLPYFNRHTKKERVEVGKWYTYKLVYDRKRYKPASIKVDDLGVQKDYEVRYLSNDEVQIKFNTQKSYPLIVYLEDENRNCLDDFYFAVDAHNRFPYVDRFEKREYVRVNEKSRYQILYDYERYKVHPDIVFYTSCNPSNYKYHKLDEYWFDLTFYEVGLYGFEIYLDKNNSQIDDFRHEIMVYDDEEHYFYSSSGRFLVGEWTSLELICDYSKYDFDPEITIRIDGALNPSGFEYRITEKNTLVIKAHKAGTYKLDVTLRNKRTKYTESSFQYLQIK